MEMYPSKPVVVEKIDERDQGTPDEWVPRHESLVRLTGRHPFNCEPPLPKLMEHGFITPASLHYVRNHGAVPKCEWGTHELRVDGLVDKPTTFTMADLLALPSRELPITLVCAGNRRKEENLVKQTIGFNWGAAGVSTSVWKGVLVRDVLLKCGVKSPKNGAHHVCFVGKETMPKGRYGTSISWHAAMDPACDVLLAYEQNGEQLTPDHGFPLRLVIPGYIGGRMIKWLTEISVTAEESDNYFHYNDNRVLPEHVTAEIANAEGWWYKPDYIINELNINSAIAYPGHQEVVTLSGGKQPYTVKGYCYSGGGRKVIRVELSVDNGKTWTLTKLNHPEQPTEYGKYWCWCFWEHEIDISDLWSGQEPAELLCRGWDASMNRQPEKITWNVMGMMNNSYFRIKVHRCLDENMRPALRFQHPTLAGPGNFGGWFEEKVFGKADAPKAAAPAAPAASTATGDKRFTMAEVEKHDTDKDCWIVVKGKVYDATNYLDDHPGGASSITIVAGSDCTEEFEALHSSKAWALLEKHLIGLLEDGSSAAPAAAPAAPQLVALNPKQWVSLPLIKNDRLSPDTRLFRFELPTAQHALGLPTGQHLFIKATIDGKPVMRAYTPVGHGLGYVDFVIKVYFANVHPAFPNGGKLTQHLEGMKLGESLLFKGPMGEYIFNNEIPPTLATFTHTRSGVKHPYAELGLIAGGSGITPVLQVAHAVLKNPEAKMKIGILYANRAEEDILCRDLLTELERDGRVSVWYTLDKPPDGWTYSTGFISEEMVRDHLPRPSKDTVTFMCGPPKMLEFACVPNLQKAGHAEGSYFSF
uniref:Nitrate reductase n=1 Tax=Coccolithus braarudii TaxID=221442 RepID=A0A7S0L9G1_9EUKA|mmetsp:Transcript_24917/g.53797  ORF Transcript_24917/g.53797 Transcript_24917/m.53797 type:complete len:812 (+) Transcript_24917:49-2484(+)